MSSTSEVGHAKNVANFQDLIAFITGYGASYNPTRANLKLTALNALLGASNANLADVITKNTAYSNAINTRIQAFSGLKSLSTRLVGALQATDATPEKIADAKGFNRKLQGKRAGSTIPSVDPATPAPATISASQQSYDQLIQHFAGLISVLQSETSYVPNEADLKLVNLNLKKTDLTVKNNAVATTYATLSNARIARDKTLYKIDTGLIDVAKEVKNYVKSLYGAASPEYAQINGIKFRKVKS